MNPLLTQIDQAFSAAITLLEHILFFELYGMPLIVLWLVGGSVFLTLRMGFINVRGLGHGLAVLWGSYDDPNEVGEVSHFQAVATAMSATVGLGNIAGVAIALQLGGPGAILWMTVAGLLGMTTKFTECTLAQQYRVIKDGQVLGGPMYYLSQGLAEQGLKPLGQVLATAFAIICMVGSLGGGNMFQANQSGMALAFLGEQLQWAWLSNPQVYGLVLAATVGAVIIGGLQRIAQVASAIVPTMVGLYLAAALWILGHHLTDIPPALDQIWYSAWHPSAVAGGIVGVMVQGLQRGVFSNGAGTGAAAIAHAATRNPEPIREGIVALIEPLIDTVIICNLTALVCLVTKVYQPGSDVVNGVELTTLAFASDIPMMTWGLAIIVCLFSFSTIISCFYYGEACWRYLLGERGLLVYKLIYILGSFSGTVISLDAILRFSDTLVFALGLPNMLGLLLLSSQVANNLGDYWQRYATTPEKILPQG